MCPRLPNPVRILAVAAAVLAFGASAQTDPPNATQPNAANQVADGGDTAAQPAPGQGQTLLEQAIVAMESRQSVAAKVRCRYDLFGRGQMVGSGSYFAQLGETGQLFRLELKLHLDDRPVTLLEVYDGRNLWTYHDLDGEKLTRIDAVQIAQALKKKGEVPTIGEIGTWPGLGGLARLLRGLNSNFQFDPPEEAAFAMTDGDQQRALPVWKLRGSWTPKRLAVLLPDQAKDIQRGKLPRLEKLAEHLPDHVIVFLGKDDLFPYEIDYCRTLPERFWQKTPPESKSIVVMEFPEVSLNVAIPPSQFTYKPGSLKPSDGTAAFISGLEKEKK